MREIYKSYVIIIVIKKEREIRTGDSKVKVIVIERHSKKSILCQSNEFIIKQFNL